MAVQTPRGIRNNNPLNIRKNDIQWQGLSPEQNDSDFCQFINLNYGIRAAFVLLRTYHKKYHCDTITKVVSRWAPECENNTKAYIEAVAAHSCVPADARFKFTDKNVVCRILWSMAWVENGKEISFQYFENAYEMV